MMTLPMTLIDLWRSFLLL